MNDLTTEPKAWQTEESSQTRRIEPDWSESEWFQVWLQLARLPHPPNELVCETRSSFTGQSVP